MKRLLTYIILCIWAGVLSAQPVPCDPENPEMTSFCDEACIICDIDGFTGRHFATIVGQAPPGFEGECTFIAHNMQWIAFIAGSENLRVRLRVSNCQLGNGLEFGLYKGVNCENLSRISNCFGGAAGIIPPGGSGVIVNNEPLVIGQYYFIVMDGAFGDNCDWTFTVEEGSTEVSPLEITNPIVGPDIVCPNVMNTFTTEEIVGATTYDWTINNLPIDNDGASQLDHTFTEDGFFTVCVVASNACDEATLACKLVEVRSIPIHYIEEVFCEGECYEVAGEQICETGNYTFNLINDDGCDSMIVADLVELPIPTTFLDLIICDGDAVPINETFYNATGLYEEIALTDNQCDSIITLNLETIECQISVVATMQPVVCFGGASGEIELSVTLGTPPFEYQWQHFQTQTNGSGNINALGEIISINNLAAGDYLINVNDNYGNRGAIYIEVTEPEKLELNLSPSIYNGFNTSCFEGNDGAILSSVTGGEMPYSYQWSNGGQMDNITDLLAGTYALQVIDALGCIVEAEVLLESPMELLMDVMWEDPGCDGPLTGTAEVIQSSGGVTPYLYALDSGYFDEQTKFSGLSPGVHSIQLKDANGCILEEEETLVEAEIPMISISDDLTINLGDSTQLNATINDIAIADLQWTSEFGVSCELCYDPYVMPFETTDIILSAASEDGCTDEVTVRITVEKNRNFYAPNIFNPTSEDPITPSK